MPNGFCPALLTSILDVAEGNAPGQKLQIAGFLAALFCCQNSSVSPVNSQFGGDGHLRPLTVKYSRRPLVSDTDTNDDCNINRIPGHQEWTVPGLNYVKHAFFLDDATVAQYCSDATRVQGTGNPSTTVIAEVYDRLVESANVVMRKINQNLVTTMATRFGINTTTNQSNGKVINIDQDGAKYVLDNGVIDMMRDLQENEICGEPCLVGGGLWSAYKMSEAIACCNAAGMDFSKTGLPRLFFDKDTQQIWGPNTAGVFAKGSVKFMGRNAFVGSFAGYKGASWFGTFLLPVNEFGCNQDDCLRDLKFDLQLKYIDCPTSINLNGVPTNVKRGWLAIVSKQYALWVQPADAYSVGDPLYGTNGTLKYYMTNQPIDPKTYAYGY